MHRRISCDCTSQLPELWSRVWRVRDIGDKAFEPVSHLLLWGALLPNLICITFPIERLRAIAFTTEYESQLGPLLSSKYLASGGGHKYYIAPVATMFKCP